MIFFSRHLASTNTNPRRSAITDNKCKRVLERVFNETAFTPSLDVQMKFSARRWSIHQIASQTWASCLRDVPKLNSWSSKDHVYSYCYVYSYVFLFLFILSSVYSVFNVPTGILRLPWLRFFRAFSTVVRQMPGYTSERRGTLRTLPN